MRWRGGELSSFVRSTSVTLRVDLLARCRFIKVANETMCRPIRSLTEARGYDASKHILAGE